MTDLITAEEAEKLLEEDFVSAERAVVCTFLGTVITLHAQLADAQAAQAMVVERAAAKADRGHGTYCRARGRDPEKYVSAFYLMAREIRALAPIDGLAMVRELRDRAEKAEAIAHRFADRHEKHLRMGAELRAERDRLAAANAVLEAKVAGLRSAFRVNMLRYGPPGTSHEEIDAAIDAALATQEAGK